MSRFHCKDILIKKCNFIAVGETADETVINALKHIGDAHSDELSVMRTRWSDRQIKEMVRSMLTEI